MLFFFAPSLLDGRLLLLPTVDLEKVWFEVDIAWSDFHQIQPASTIPKANRFSFPFPRLAQP